jgi:hypothetical protein
MSNSVLKSFAVGCKQVGYMLRAMCLKLSTKLLKLLFPYLNTHTHAHTADKTSSRELEEASSPSITIVGFPEINFLKPPQNNRNTHTQSTLSSPSNCGISCGTCLQRKSTGPGFKELHR